VKTHHIVVGAYWGFVNKAVSTAKLQCLIRTQHQTLWFNKSKPYGKIWNDGLARCTTCDLPSLLYDYLKGNLIIKGVSASQ